jgi:uncharacterized protein
MRVVVLADTHVRASTASGPALPGAVYRDLRRAEVILHAGDVVTAGLLVELGTFAPVFAVLGNNDADLGDDLPPTLEIDLGGVPVAMIHDAGPREGRAARMHRRFPDARLVVYGHSHQPDDRVGEGRQRLFNPGSPTRRRRAAYRSYGVVGLGNGRLTSHRVVELPPG